MAMALLISLFLSANPKVPWWTGRRMSSHWPIVQCSVTWGPFPVCLSFEVQAMLFTTGAPLIPGTASGVQVINGSRDADA